MSFFRHISTSRTGPETHVTGVSDITLVEIGDTLSVYSASGRDGGVLARSAGLQVTDDADYRATVGLGAQAQLQVVSLGGRDALLVTGPTQAGISGFWLTAQGQIAGRFDLPGPTVEAMTAMEMVSLGGQNYFFTSSHSTPGITAWQHTGSDQLVQRGQVSVALQDAGNDIFALEHVVTGGQNFLMAVSANGHGLHSFSMGGDGALRLADSVDMSDGLGVSTPTELAQVSVGGQTFMLVGAAGSSSITVVLVNNDGSLRPTDQVNDDRDTRFQSISVLEAIEVDGRAYVLAGGADDGLSLMTLLPTGRLLHLETIADDLETALTNPSSFALSVLGDRIALYTAGLMDDAYGASGIGRFEIDPHAGSVAGEVLQGGQGDDQLTGTTGADQILGGAGDDRLWGGDGADIILDGAGEDQMWGGAGADIFVLSGDGERDSIRDFELGVDRIDMSQMGRFYTVEALQASSRGNGIEFQINGEKLQIRTSDSSMLQAEDFHYSDLIGLWHVSTDLLPKGDQQIQGSIGNDMIQGAEGADTIAGGAGGDTIMGGAGNDVLLGGIVDDVFDPLAATVFRLYAATLDRAPDTGGHRSWVEILSEGQRSLTEVASGFVRSAEFQRDYGNVSNNEFITLLYNNVLDRAPDQGGLNSWMDAIATGSSRAQVVTGFSESREFKVNTTAEALNFSMESYSNDWLDDVYRMYSAALDRTPDRNGLEYWAERLAQGTTVAEAAGGFSGSREFQNTYGTLNEEGFVRLMYRNVLDRDADDSGLKYWTDTLAQGASRGDVLSGFSQSREFTTRTAPELYSWVVDQGTDDMLEGGGGRNVLFGGMWSDTFVFNVTSNSVHEVADLEDWDQLRFDGFGYDTAADVRTHLRQDGEDVVFADQGVEVRLVNVDISMMANDNLFDV